MKRFFAYFLFTGLLLSLFYLKSPDIRSYDDGEFVEPALNLNPLETYARMRFPGIDRWTRPEGDATVALQVGHWKVEEHPDELANLRNNFGSFGNEKMEWEVNYAIAQQAKIYLEEYGVKVELLPATIPSGYWADVFVAIHADGSEDKSATGYKAARAWYDMTGKADELVDDIEYEYKKATGFVRDENITPNMKGYYAFRWWRYDHAVHPMTTAAIIETGFLTNSDDQKIIVDHPEVSGKAIAEGLMDYLHAQDLLK